MVWQPGHQLQDGKYTITLQLGEGGFGITYLAQLKGGNPVVVKTLNEKIRQKKDFEKCQQDFLNEALWIAKCSHPHILRVEELIQEEGVWCIVMEYIEGTNLGNLVDAEGALPEEEALHYIRQVGDALNTIHHQGFLHRDVKPLNILRRKDRASAVLIDFGMVRKFMPNLVQNHTAYVSKGFAPIEQYDWRAFRGAYTDVYGLAATLYALLTEEVPESAGNRDRRVARNQDDPLIPPQQLNPLIGDRTNQAILDGMALEPEDRPQSIREWFDLLGIELISPPWEALVPVGNTEGQWPSAVGMDYSHLQQLLDARDWQAADKHTEQLLLEMCDRTVEGRLAEKQVKHLPGRDLRTLDRLWVNASNGHFGFSVQNRIWRSADKNYEAFGDLIGWRTPERSWLAYADLIFDLSAPEGHLPTWGRRGRLWPYLGTRLKRCGL
ncbi:serine/threonine-protein kinase [Roseofilum casamattae]|uniref:non-specific serine/threonine protein kinase n=1 Tax=Roseofilum casamattae BLCC-M143 TaxID=3022442 RepID=A0ABT7BUP7_9CYAN|nr:serine/threonine-protein kinase [Roseofilum casamattae]MDJ1182512.1 serine/threonine-protein kinase [Roseofilum casamattae BLCC-M143]